MPTIVKNCLKSPYLPMHQYFKKSCEMHHNLPRYLRLQDTLPTPNSRSFIEEPRLIPRSHWKLASAPAAAVTRAKDAMSISSFSPPDLIQTTQQPVNTSIAAAIFSLRDTCAPDDFCRRVACSAARWAFLVACATRGSRSDTSVKVPESCPLLYTQS